MTPWQNPSLVGRWCQKQLGTLGVSSLELRSELCWGCSTNLCPPGQVWTLLGLQHQSLPPRTGQSSAGAAAPISAPQGNGHSTAWQGSRSIWKKLSGTGWGCLGACAEVGLHDPRGSPSSTRCSMIYTDNTSFLKSKEFQSIWSRTLEKENNLNPLSPWSERSLAPLNLRADPILLLWVLWSYWRKSDNTWHQNVNHVQARIHSLLSGVSLSSNRALWNDQNFIYMF